MKRPRDPLSKPTRLLRAAAHARDVGEQEGRWSRDQIKWASQLAIRAARLRKLVIPGYEPHMDDAIALAQRMLDRIRTEVTEEHQT